MDEKNDYTVTEKDVFIYIREHVGCKKTEIINGLGTNRWMITSKLRNLTQIGAIAELGARYRITPAFLNIDPVFENHQKGASKYQPTIDVYKTMLTGKPLDDIQATDDVKSIIRLIEKNKTLSAWQIYEKFGVSTWLTTEMRRLERVKRRNSCKKTFLRSPALGWTVRQIALGTPVNVIREKVTDETIRKAIVFVTMINSGAGYHDVSKSTHFKNDRIKTTFDTYKSKYATQLKDFEPEKYMPEVVQ